MPLQNKFLRLTARYAFPTGKQMAKTKPALAIALQLGWRLLREGRKVELRGKSSWTKGIRLPLRQLLLVESEIWTLVL